MMDKPTDLIKWIKENTDEGDTVSISFLRIAPMKTVTTGSFEVAADELRRALGGKVRSVTESDDHFDGLPDVTDPQYHECGDGLRPGG